jgi:hypothetical protein
MHEGWSRCAAEALLMGVGSLIHPTAGLADLATLTNQPAPDLPRLQHQVPEQATTPHPDMKNA